MKVVSIAALLLAEAVFAAPANGKRQSLAILGTLFNGNYGRQPPISEGPKPKRDPSPLKIDGLKVERVKVRTGPYLVPNMGRRNLASSHYGMLESYYDPNITKPCESCNILRQVGGLEYADGTNANIDSGMWLHHMVHFNTGNRRWDPVGAPSTVCLPFDGINAPPKKISKTISAKNTERYFVTGNERTPFNFYNPDSTTKSAYHLDAEDQFFFLVELMNMNMKDMTVYITMTYDIVDGPLPANWSEVKTIFLDAQSCGTSERPSPKEAGKFKQSFNIDSSQYKYISSIEGPIVDSMGHLHDGGTTIEIKSGSEGVFCKSTAMYSQKPEYVAKAMGGTRMTNGDLVAVDHISNMEGCGMKDMNVKSMRKGQVWTVNGNYDYSKHAPNEERPGPSEVMAIAIVLVAVKPGVYDKYKAI